MPSLFLGIFPISTLGVFQLLLSAFFMLISAFLLCNTCSLNLVHASLKPLISCSRSLTHLRRPCVILSLFNSIAPLIQVHPPSHAHERSPCILVISSFVLNALCLFHISRLSLSPFLYFSLPIG